jgi:hypothetical protein
MMRSAAEVDLGNGTREARARVGGLPADPLGFASILRRDDLAVERDVLEARGEPSERRQRPRGRRGVTPGTVASRLAYPFSEDALPVAHRPPGR